MTTRRVLTCLVPVALVIAACSKTPTDDTLKNDLALASQAQNYTPQPVMSPAEQQASNPYVAPVRHVQTASTAPAPVRRTATRTSAPVVYAPAPAPAPAPQPTVKHTTRDAGIGAAAGAVIGAVASRDKVKGGLIGAAAGAILGGVIGNNVDIKRP